MSEGIGELYSVGRLLIARECRTWNRIGATIDRKYVVVRKEKAPGEIFFVVARDLAKVETDKKLGEVTYRSLDPNKTPQAKKRLMRLKMVALFERVGFTPFRWEDAGLPTNAIARFANGTGPIEIIDSEAVFTATIPPTKYVRQIYRFKPDAEKILERYR